MKKVALIVVAMVIVCQLSSGCERAARGIEAKESLEEDAPRVSRNTIQIAVTGLLMEAGVAELDSSYDEVDTKAEVKNVTAGNGAFSLYEHLSTSYPIYPAYDISKTGKVSVD